ncbi:MAG: hypothetical protein LQ338_000251 [Usnochroma carphineum]|nr:MAG: hypothetical protein LQ338_000251 [Usnochroma carphineum]
MPRLLRSDEHAIADECPSDSDEVDLDSADFESQGLTTSSYLHRRQTSSSLSLIKNLPALLTDAIRRQGFQTRGLPRPRRRTKSRRSSRFLFFLQCLAGVIVALILFTALFAPSYSTRPPHYDALKQRVLTSKEHGRGNSENEKIFVVASIYDKGGHLVNGAWGHALLELIEVLGNRNVFLSIYENDAGDEAKEALYKLKDRVQCPSELVFERHVSLKTIPSVVLPDASERIKRIAYLANIRNRALRPLDMPSDVKYDKLLFLNDVVFDPIQIAQLLFSTNADESGKSSYMAACAVDFINPFKFYDTFATRDAEGYSMGVPFFPWFSDAGKGISRKDVREGKDAVRVKSCWGGIVAFDASYFQANSIAKEEEAALSPTNATQATTTDAGLPIRFRAEPELYWEASECCLVHADLQRASQRTLNEDDVGIYINPYVRVAYGTWTLWWLPFIRRIEKLFTVPHTFINHLAGMPRHNPRRTETGGKDSKERVWVPDKASVAGGSFEEVSRVVESGGYCGFRTLQLIKDTVRKGEKNWETMPVPPGD